MRLLVTGGCGFIGSNLVRHLLRERPEAEVVNLDALSYAGNPENLREVEEDARYRFVRGDVADPEAVANAIRGCDAVLHLAAESHVDRSIEGDAVFVRTNVEGTRMLLRAALDEGVGRFVHVSTDEVYGSLPWRDPAEDSAEEPVGGRPEAKPGEVEYFTEESPLRPRSPYSASKAASDHLVAAYHHTHGLDAVVTRCSNNYGPYQFPEKLIPLMITNALEGRELPVYGDGLNVRDWIWVEDHCSGLLAALERGAAGRTYNFGGRAERTNLQVVRAILESLGLDEEAIAFVGDRPGHDRRYAVDPARAESELGWSPGVSFEEGLARTVAWYRENRAWCERVRSGAYRRYYEEMYGEGGRHARMDEVRGAS